MENPRPAHLRTLIQSPPEGYWERGSGDADLEIREADGSSTSLLILPHPGLGYYLKYLVSRGSRVAETWLSLHDRSRLGEVATCSDEWFASVGLFLTPEAAAIAAEEFVLTGQRSQLIDWISPRDIPEGGNW